MHAVKTGIHSANKKEIKGGKRHSTVCSEAWYKFGTTEGYAGINRRGGADGRAGAAMLADAPVGESPSETENLGR